MSEISEQVVVWSERSRFGDIRQFSYNKTKNQITLFGHNVSCYQWTSGHNNEMLSVDPDGGPNIMVRSVMPIPPTGEMVIIEKVLSASKNSKTKVFTAVFLVKSYT